MLTIKLIRNQSDPARYVRYVTYETKDGTCTPYGHLDNRARKRLEWSQIDRSKQRNGVLDGWSEHIASQSIRELPEHPVPSRATLIALGLITPVAA